ncbi:DJ-1/PfpI family protein [Bifidobacterium sp.]|jgi:transcriptional regulator GlxA family with amidase domain|uniref:DJ-1/PfpI family protein n=1 Tax=Bifidobacterium sp. TaxID=41200 RepID=UPI0025BE1BCC|nr:DJ-1/PfpI family protein [Bifidobacterium sp.]MCI1634705.1 DJ-1/PfpI family protein [Bifidobacterium sp.]
MQDIAILLFDGFEPLDVFGPAEVFGCIERIDNSAPAPQIQYCSINGGMIHGAISTTIETVKISDIHDDAILLIPGGAGTRPLVKSDIFLNALNEQLPRFSEILTVCTGSALLAATGNIDGRNATSNKRAFAWVQSVRPQVNWLGSARWVDDGDVLTSSGVSAGIDMALGLVSKVYGPQFASTLAKAIEYVWNDDPDNDPFAVQ